jgi:hypothetical protein
MKVRLLQILFFSFLFGKVFSQVYIADKPDGRYLVHFLNSDTAIIERFSHNFYFKIQEDILIRKYIDSTFIGKYYLLNKKGNIFYVNNKIPLIALDKNFNGYKNQQVSYLKKRLFSFNDSLSGPFEMGYTSLDTLFDFLKNKNHPYLKFLVNSRLVFQNVVDSMVKAKPKLTDYYYRKIDSLAFLDSGQILGLLSLVKSQYPKPSGSFFCNKLIFEISKKRPEILIHYLEQNPTNKKQILSSIQNHERLNEIGKNVKSVKDKKKVKKLISRYIRRKKVGNFMGPVIYGTIILGEISLLIFLFSLI